LESYVSTKSLKVETSICKLDANLLFKSTSTTAWDPPNPRSLYSYNATRDVFGNLVLLTACMFIIVLDESQSPVLSCSLSL